MASDQEIQRPESFMEVIIQQVMSQKNQDEAQFIVDLISKFGCILETEKLEQEFDLLTQKQKQKLSEYAKTHVPTSEEQRILNYTGEPFEMIKKDLVLKQTFQQKHKMFGSLALETLVVSEIDFSHNRLKFFYEVMNELKSKEITD